MEHARYEIQVCRRCLDDAPGECHDPRCLFCRMVTPSLEWGTWREHLEPYISTRPAVELPRASFSHADETRLYEQEAVLARGIALHSFDLPRSSRHWQLENGVWWRCRGIMALGLFVEADRVASSDNLRALAACRAHHSREWVRPPWVLYPERCEVCGGCPCECAEYMDGWSRCTCKYCYCLNETEYGGPCSDCNAGAHQG